MKRSLRTLFILGSRAGITIAATLLIWRLGFLGTFENLLWDFSFWYRGQMSPPDNVLIVDFETWPVPRDRIAKAVELIRKGGAKVIALDILFDTPRSEEEDKALFQVVSKEDTVLALEIHKMTGKETQVILPLEDFTKRAWGIGFVNVMTDPDSVVRDARLAVKTETGILYSLPLLIASRYLGLNSPSEIVLEKGGIKFDSERADTTRNYTLRICYFGAEDIYSPPKGGTSQVLLADDLFNMNDLGILDQKKIFDGKIILVGSTSRFTRDLHRTPFSGDPRRGSFRETPGIIIQANIVSHLLEPSRHYRDYRGYGLLLLGIAITLFTLLSIKTKPVVSLVVTLVFLILGAYLTVILFINKLVVLPAGMVLLGLMVNFPLSLWYHYLEESRGRRWIKSVFGHYLQKEIADAILHHREKIALGGETRDVTILFCDIVGFTAMAEKLPSHKVVELLNRYFASAYQIIKRHRGILNKYMGDGILAIFGAPVENEEHAKDAIASSIELVRATTAIQEGFKNDFGIERFEITVGLHSGETTLGNIGAPERIEYTVIGDTVNIAQRLERECRLRNRPILLSGATAKGSRDAFKLEYVADISLKGRIQIVSVYAVEAEQDYMQP